MDSEVFAHLTDRGVELAKKLAHGGKVTLWPPVLAPLQECISSSAAGATARILQYHLQGHNARSSGTDS